MKKFSVRNEKELCQLDNKNNEKKLLKINIMKNYHENG
jgi:hypothetical protein